MRSATKLYDDLLEADRKIREAVNAGESDELIKYLTERADAIRADWDEAEKREAK